MLANAGDHEGIAFRGVRYRLNHLLAEQIIGLANPERWMFRFQVLDVLDPLGVRRLVDHRVQLVENGTHVAQHRRFNLNVLADFRGVDVDVDFFRVNGESFGVARDSVVEARSDVNDEIRVVQREA